MVKTYDPRGIVISIAGLLIQRGFAEDSMVKVAFTSPRFESKVGVDGEVTRARLHDRRATATLSLMQSSDGNDILSALLRRDTVALPGAGVGSFLMRDLQGTTLVFASAAWVKGIPEVEYGKSVGTRAWEIELADCDATLGGNVVGL